MTTVYCCCSWGWDLCQAIQSCVSAVAAHTSCAAPELCGAVSSSGWQLVAAILTSPAAVTVLPCTQAPKSGCRFSLLPSSQHQGPSNSKGCVKTESTRKQLFMHFQHCSLVNLCFLFNAVRWRKEPESISERYCYYLCLFRSFKLGHFTKKSSNF